MFDNYLIDNHKEDLITILKDEDIEKHFSIIINFGKLFENCAEICNNLLEKPRKTLRKLNQESLKAQRKLLEDSESEYTEKRNVHVRISGLPACPELHRTTFPGVNDLGAFLQISGTVVRMTASKMLEYQRNYRCTKCKQVSTLKADYEQRFVFNPPKFCSGCNNKNVVQINELAPGNCKDYQEVRLQEQISKLSLGTIPTSMWVTLEDNLVDLCKPGDDITVCGVVMRRWKPVANKKLDVELVLRANYVEVNNDQRSIRLITPEVKTHFNDFWEAYKHAPLIGRDIILRSICPELYGLYIVKLALAVILAGGSEFHKNDPSEIKIRSEPHLLLVGDPGMGKSQLLRFASKVIPRSVLTTGIGCTSAGLTVAAVMEEGEWHLEAGALVLSDEGICCIDEFNSMKEHDKASIHEAMEQQTISVAKASMVCKLNTRCSVLAAMNNKDKSAQISMSSPLLSRFDLVLLLRDSFNPKWDNTVCDFILNNQTIDTDKNDKQLWTIELVQAYFTVIKGLHPVLTDEANCILRAYYQAQRQAPERNKARTTVRLLDSLVRLSQAHARFMFRSEVLVIDAVMAVALIESSMQSSAILLPVSADNLHTPFPSDPVRTYKELMSNILQKLKLFSVFNNELSKMKCKNINKNIEMGNNFDKNIEKENDKTGYEIGSTSYEIENDNTNDDMENYLNNSIDKIKEKNKNNKNIEKNYLNESNDKIKENIENYSDKIGKNTNSKKHSLEKCNKRKNSESDSSSGSDKNENISKNKKTVENQKIVHNNKKNNFKQTLNISPNQDNVFKKPDNKRKRAENLTKKSKKIKRSEMNDSELLNFVPSVNDIFELDEMDLMLEPNFTHFEEPSTQEKNETNKKTNGELKNKFTFKNRIGDNSNISNENISDDDKNQNSKFVNNKNGKHNKIMDVSPLKKSIKENSELSDKNRNLNNSDTILNNSSESNVSNENLDRIKSNSFEFLQQFAFKKTPKKDVENSNSKSITNNETSKISPENHKNPDVSNCGESSSSFLEDSFKLSEKEISSKFSEMESFSQTSSELTAKTLFQSQDDNFDDLNLDL